MNENLRGHVMNKEWSDLNKQMQIEIKKKDTFDDGINTLLKLRKKLMEQIIYNLTVINKICYYTCII